jgi:hypothetical protein
MHGCKWHASLPKFFIWRSTLLLTCIKCTKQQHIKFQLTPAVLATLILYDYICKKFLHVTGECIKAKCRLG